MIGTTSSSSMAMATALAFGQSRLRKNSSDSSVRDHQLVGAAEQRRDHVFAHRRDEHQQRAGDDAGHRQRQRDAQEGLDRPGAEIVRGLEQRVVVLLEVGVQRQDHERQVGIDDADVDREAGVHHRRAARR